MIAARETCHRLGVPHVTLDLREEFRRAVVTPFVRGYARGETPNPCTRCNGGFRFDELLAFARRIGAERLATGHYARDRRARRPAADRPRAPIRRRTRATCSRRSIRGSSRGSGSRSATRTRRRRGPRPRRAGLAAARKPESQEACFLGGDDYRAFLGRHGLEPREGAIVGEDGSELGRHDGFWRFTPGQRRGLGLSAAEPLYVLDTQPRRTPSSSGRASRSRARRSALAAGSTSRPSASRRSSATAHRRCPRGSRRRTAASDSCSTSLPTASRPARRRCSTTATPSSDTA